MKKLKIKNWTSCIQNRSIRNYMSRRPKHSTIRVVESKEEGGNIHMNEFGRPEYGDSSYEAS
jgi:hypothetical protein